MLTMFALDKLLETITKTKDRTPPRRLQRSPKIVGYYREDDEYLEMSSELREPLLSSSRVKDDCDDQGKNIKGVKQVSNKSQNNIRVKVLLTKEEAAKMLSKCKGEGALDFKDVVNELMKLPAQRINIVPEVVLRYRTIILLLVVMLQRLYCWYSRTPTVRSTLLNHVFGLIVKNANSDLH
uniref:DUF7890 domain-containing protein n=1 Tax=Chenopodium quinoa TaxID=63459 RepID=A0A803LWJ1_CHEQI